MNDHLIQFLKNNLWKNNFLMINEDKKKKTKKNLTNK
jgi:hypothetical protein